MNNKLVEELMAWMSIRPDLTQVLKAELRGIIERELSRHAKAEEPLALECMRICTMWIDPMAVPNDVEATIAKARAYLEGLDDKGAK